MYQIGEKLMNVFLFDLCLKKNLHFVIKVVHLSRIILHLATLPTNFDPQIELNAIRYIPVKTVRKSFHVQSMNSKKSNIQLINSAINQD